MAEEKIDNPHDKRLKELFRNKRAFLSLLKDCVKNTWADKINEDTLKPYNAEFVLQDFSEKRLDVLYEATLKDGETKIFFYVILELQSSVDYRMPFRLLLYITEILRRYYQNADVDKRKTKDFKFPVVFPIVFFNQNSEWNVPLNLKEMFSDFEIFGNHVINFEYAFVHVKDYDEENVKNFQSRLLRIMMLFEKATSIESIDKIAEKYYSEISDLDEEERRIIGFALKIFKNQYGQANTVKGGETVMIDNLIEEYEKDLLDEARKAEKTEIAEKLFKMGLTAEQVAQGTGVTPDEARKIKENLKI